MLRYNLHYLATEVCRYLEYSSTLKEEVYVHWACCKVESIELDEVVYRVVVEKLKEYGEVSYTEIAKKAIEVGKL